MLTLLIVDDETNFVRSLSAGLRRYEIEALAAENGKEALEILKAADVDVILTDLRMPQMDGFELIAEVRTKYPEAPIIAMTAFGTPSVFDRLKNLGSLYYVEKPLDLEHLVKVISDAYDMRLRGHVTGIALAAFLQLVDLERKTCTLTVRSQNQSGTLYCKNGQIIHAKTEEDQGIDAAYKMLAWDDVTIDIGNTCSIKEKTISRPTQVICFEGTRLKDEQGGEETSEPTVGQLAAPSPEDETSGTNEPSSGTPENGQVVGAGASSDASPQTAKNGENSLKNHYQAHRDAIRRLGEIQLQLMREIGRCVAAAVVDVEAGIPLAAAKASPDLDLSFPTTCLTQSFSLALKAFGSSGWGGVDQVVTLGEEYNCLAFALKGGRYLQATVVDAKVPVGTVRTVFAKLRETLEGLCP